MKKLLIASSLFVAMAFTTNSAKAQVALPTVSEINVAVGNLVTIQGVDVNVILQDITIQDVIDVSNVLNNNNVDLNILRTVTIDNVLNNTLRDADFLNDNQVVVGVVLNLLGGVEQILVADKKPARKK
jgi:transketolase C-terminal domain/subunit